MLAAWGCEVRIVDRPPPPQKCQEGRCGPKPDACLRYEARAFARSLVEDAAEGVAPNLLDLPPELRTKNYYKDGSCCHAAIQDVLKWHGFYELARWWRQNYYGAFGVSSGARVMDRLGLQYVCTTNGDERLLEWCSRNRHGAAIHYYRRHAITFRGYADGYAILCDNNRTHQLIRVPKATFIQRWKGYGGCAITVVYSPAPPIPVP